MPRAGSPRAHPIPRRRSTAPRYILELTPLPGVDGVKALRWVLKSALRKHGLRCTDLRAEGEKGASSPLEEAS
jgi:hypothetical protein